MSFTLHILLLLCSFKECYNHIQESKWTALQRLKVQTFNSKIREKRVNEVTGIISVQQECTYVWQEHESTRVLRILLQLFIQVRIPKAPKHFEHRSYSFYRSEIKSRNILKMKQTWRQKSETINRLSPSTVSLEGSFFPSGVHLLQQSFIKFQETLYVVLAGSLGKNIFLFITSDPWLCLVPDFRGEVKRDTDTVNHKMTGKTDAICSYLL